MAIRNPKQLVDEFKKSGEFDRLRRQLLTHFANSDEVRPLMSRVEQIARDKLASDERLEHKTRETVHSEVMQDMERYPIVERAVSDLAVLKDETLLTSIEEYVRNIVRGQSNENTKLWKAKPSRRRRDEDEDNGESSDYTDDEDPDDDELLITEAERKTNSASPTAEPQTAPAAGQAVQNGPTSPIPISRAVKTSLSGAMSPRTSSPSQCEPVDMNPQPPPWSIRDEDAKASLSRVTSSDAGEHLVNGVPVGGSASDGLAKETPVVHKQEQDTIGIEDTCSNPICSPGRQDTHVNLHAETDLGPSAFSRNCAPDLEMKDTVPPSSASRAQSVLGFHSEQPPQTQQVVTSSYPPRSSPAHTLPPLSSVSRSLTRSPTRSASPSPPRSSESLPACSNVRQRPFVALSAFVARTCHRALVSGSFGPEAPM